MIDPTKPVLRPVCRLTDIDPTQGLIRAVVAGYPYNPGHSDLDDEQPIHVRMTLGDYRLACRLRSAAPGEYRVTFLAEDGTRTVLGNQPPMDANAAADMARRCNEQDETAEARAEKIT